MPIPSYEDQFRSLRQAIENNNLAAVRAILQTDDSETMMRLLDQNREKTLHWAASVANINSEIISLLIEEYKKHNVSLDNLNIGDKTAFALAVENNQEAMVRLLIAEGVEINGRVFHLARVPRPLTYKSPIQHAVERGFLNLVKLLLEHGPNLNAVDSIGLTPIPPTREGQIGASINPTLLQWAAMKNCNLDIIRALLDSRLFNINDLSNIGQTALGLAAYYGHISIVELLISYRADVNIVREDLDSPLKLAVEMYDVTDEVEVKERYKAIIRALISAGAYIQSSLDLALSYEIRAEIVAWSQSYETKRRRWNTFISVLAGITVVYPLVVAALYLVRLWNVKPEPIQPVIVEELASDDVIEPESQASVKSVSGFCLYYESFLKGVNYTDRELKEAIPSQNARTALRFTV